MRTAYFYKLSTSVAAPRYSSYFIEVYFRKILTMSPGVKLIWRKVIPSKSVFNWWTPFFFLIFGLLVWTEIDMQKILEIIIKLEVYIISILINTYPFRLIFNIYSFCHLTNRRIFLNIFHNEFHDQIILMFLFNKFVFWALNLTWAFRKFGYVIVVIVGI